MDWPWCVSDGGDLELQRTGQRKEREGRLFQSCAHFWIYSSVFHQQVCVCFRIYYLLHIMQHVTPQSPRKVGPVLSKEASRTYSEEVACRNTSVFRSEPGDTGLIPKVSCVLTWMEAPFALGHGSRKSACLCLRWWY